MDVALVAVGAILVLTLVVTAGRAVARWRGGSRVLAFAVIAGVAAWAIKLAFDVRSDPTSHNLWPFEAVGVAGLALIVLGTCALARARVRSAQ